MQHPSQCAGRLDLTQVQVAAAQVGNEAHLQRCCGYLRRLAKQVCVLLPNVLFSSQYLMKFGALKMSLAQKTSVMTMLVATLGVSACNTTTIEGPITLSEYSTRVYNTYQDEADPKAMAVTVDGAFATFAYCPTAECRNGIQTAVIRFCSAGRDESGITDAPCQLFALGDRVVWKGEVRLHGQ